LKFLNLIWRNRTKTIGYVGLIFSALAASPLFPPVAVQWFLLISSLITITVGHFNTIQRDKLEANQKDPPV
jgi:hypothetical protein